MEKWYDDVCENLKSIRYQMAEACIRAGRQSEEVTLLGVTKTVDIARINAALDHGLTCIGENRVQEFLQKKDDLHLSGKATHLIGHLQTNKVNSIVGQVDCIESVDSLRIAQAIDAASAKCGRVTDVLVEVNIGGEESKSGVSPEQLEELLHTMAPLRAIRIQGLMTVPPILETEREKRAIFSKMLKLFIDIRGKNIDNVNMHTLSMGMSSDFVEAILEGSTQIRVGSLLFGPRLYQ